MPHEQPEAERLADEIETLEQAARILREWAGDRQRGQGKWTGREQAAVECAIKLEAAAVLRARQEQNNGSDSDTSVASDLRSVRVGDARLWDHSLEGTVEAERARRGAARLRELRQIFSDGVDVARSYGDNAYHLWGEQLERQFQRAFARIEAGEFNVQLEPGEASAAHGGGTEMVTCFDCGLPYTDFQLDTHVPRSQWLQIYPEEHGGVLCANCILKRAAERIPGATVAHLIFEVAPGKASAAPPQEQE